MASFIHVVMFGAALIAFIAWVLAAFSTLNVVNLAPKGEKLTSYFQLGLWQFASLEARLGPQVRPHLTCYKRAFFAFCAVIVAILALSFLIPLLRTA
jgi:hypothetical protein